jgi:hypothetical protein
VLIPIRNLQSFALLSERLGEGRHERSMIFSGFGDRQDGTAAGVRHPRGEAGWSWTTVHEVGTNMDSLASMAGMALRLLRSRWHVCAAV